MKRSILAALSGAAVLAGAGSASAEIMDFSAYGNWNSSHTPFGWSVDIVFDTDQAVESTWTDYQGAVGHKLTVSQTISGSESNGHVPITSFVLYQSANALVASVPGGSVGIDCCALFAGILPFDESITTSAIGYGGFFWHGPGTYLEEEFSYHVALTDLGPSPVPEPAAWAAMIVGLFGAGALLRRRRLPAI